MAKRIHISERTLVARINRVFAREYGKGVRSLKKTHPRGAQREPLGKWYVVDKSKKRGVMDHHVDLEELGQRLGVLHSYERVKEPR